MKLPTIIVLSLFVIVTVSLRACFAEAYTDPAVALAASCVGEGHWNSIDTDDCAGILFVYLKISKRVNKPLIKIVKKYSAAIKPRKDHPAPWKLHLNADGRKPKFWPKNMRWKDKQQTWFDTLDFVQRFLEGAVNDPFPTATHYGGPKDIPHKSLKKLATPGTHNYFYESRWKK